MGPPRAFLWSIVTSGRFGQRRKRCNESGNAQRYLAGFWFQKERLGRSVVVENGHNWASGHGSWEGQRSKYLIQKQFSQRRDRRPAHPIPCSTSFHPEALAKDKGVGRRAVGGGKAREPTLRTVANQMKNKDTKLTQLIPKCPTFHQRAVAIPQTTRRLHQCRLCERHSHYIRIRHSTCTSRNKSQLPHTVGTISFPPPHENLSRVIPSTFTERDQSRLPPSLPTTLFCLFSTHIDKKTHKKKQCCSPTKRLLTPQILAGTPQS
jgi:hypothetical protein